MLALESLGRVSIRHPSNSQAIGSAIFDFLDGSLRNEATRAAAAAAYSGWLAKTGKETFIDKTPRYYLIANFLAEIFPDARFIVLLRDPFDIAASYRSTWNVDLPDLLRREADDPLTFDLPVGLARLQNFIAAHPDKTHVVRYEDLTADPAAALAGVLAHLGRPEPADSVAALTSISPGKKIEGRMGDRKIARTAAPHAGSVGGGRAAFDGPDRQILLDAIGASRLRALGYGELADALAAEGVLDRGEDLAAHHLARLEALIAERRNDMARESTLGVDLPADVQRRIHAALAGGAAWEAEIGGGLPALREESRRIAVAVEEALRRMDARSDESVAAREAFLAEISRLKEELAAVRHENNELRRNVAQREIRLHAVLASTSWRVTAPLRGLAGLLRRRN